MALPLPGTAIGAVTKLLQDHLLALTFDVTVGKPEEAAAKNANAKLNLFLYETGFDGHMRNYSLRDGEQPPLWMVLKYLLTAFDDDEKSDSIEAHELLGQGISALHDANFLTLQGNLEPLRLTFDEATADLLSKIMQGTDERYRLSVAFQVRPVAITTSTEAHAALLVGIDYTTSPETIIGKDGVAIDVVPSFRPRLASVTPGRFENGESIEIRGADLHGNDIEIVLDDAVLTIVERRPDRVVATVEGNPGTPIADGTAISAGEHPLVARRRLSPTRTRSSNLLAARLLPTVTGASFAAGTLTINGRLLGTGHDDVVVAFYQEGQTVRLFDTVTPSANQQTLTVTGITGVPAGQYRVILRVNNQQAKASPTVTV